MSSRIAYPFLTLPDGAVGFRGWMIGDPGEPLLPASDIFDGWDYERDLEIHTECRFNFERVADALGVTASDAVLRVTLKAGTGAGTLPRRPLFLLGRRTPCCREEFSLEEPPHDCGSNAR
jgi:hypothetical protein